MELACTEGGNAAEVNHAAAAPDDDTLSVGPDVTELPMDAAPDADTPTHQNNPPTEREEEETTVRMEQGTVEEDTVRDETPLSQAEEQQEGRVLPEQQDRGDEEQSQESVPQTEEEVAVEEKEAEAKAQQDSEDPTAAPMDEETAAVKENPPSQEVLQDVMEAGETSCAPCSCQSVFTNYSSHTPSRRKTRPCSLPVSELETVIASACGDPETPRSHYIRIHHLLHSLPSARVPSQEKEPMGEEERMSSDVDSNITSPTLNTYKEEWGQKGEDTVQSPSQVGPPF